jgi:CHAT domain-containing protein
MLADEFFVLGARDVVSTAWATNDIAAELFVERFYDALISGSEDVDGGSVGAAVRRAREALWAERHLFAASWAAYQHYTRL